MSVHIYKTTKPHEGNLRAERIRNSGEPLFCVLCWSFTCHDVHHHEETCPLWYFLFKNTNHEPNKLCTWHEPWLICKTYQLITLQGNIYFQFVPVHINYFVRLKKMFGAWRKCAQHFFNIEFNNVFYQVFHL